MGLLYIHQRGAFGVARFDNLGNAKALTRGTGDRIGSTSLCNRQPKVKWHQLRSPLNKIN